MALTSQTCCFSGSRIEKIPADTFHYEAIKSDLAVHIKQAIADGFAHFITGMCTGIDLWAAEIVIAEREARKQAGLPPITLECALPFRAQSKGWAPEWKSLHQFVLNHGDAPLYCASEKYTRGCFHQRNCYMVDRSSRLIYLQDSINGGTGHTVAYAHIRGIETVSVRQDILDYRKMRL